MTADALRIIRQSPIYPPAIEAYQFVGLRARAAQEWMAESAQTYGERSPVAWGGSLALHLLVVLTAVIVWLYRGHQTDMSPALVPVELVRYADDTNVKTLKLPDVRPLPVVETPREILNQLVAQSPTIPIPDADPGAPQPTPNSQPVLAAAPSPTQVPLRQPQSPPNPRTIGSSSTTQIPTSTSPMLSAPADAHVAQNLVVGVGPKTTLTADILALLRSQVQACWNMPPDAPKIDRLAVDFNVFLNPDGSLARPPQLAGEQAERAPHDPELRVAAEATRHAIYACAPYHLPADQYAQWREITPLHFDPATFVVR